MSDKTLPPLCEATQALDALLHELEKLAPTRRIPFPNGNGIDFIPEGEILYLQANGNYCQLILLAGKKMLVSLSLKKAETLLDPTTFCRIHHSYVINLRHLERYERGEGGTVRMNGGSVLPVSKSRRGAFLIIANNQKTSI